MNTHNLVQHYATLTPWERVPLLVAASARADEVERDRLARSAPQYTFRVPDYWGLGEGLDDLAQRYLLSQLDLAACYWRIAAFLHQEPLGCSRQQGRQHQQRLGKMLKVLAHFVAVRVDGWQLLCAGLHLDPDTLLRQLPGYEAVQGMEQLARLGACTAAEAAAYLQETAEPDSPAAGEAPAGRQQCHIDTAADVARPMREFLQAHLASWQ